jgi:hypothetical protein
MLELAVEEVAYEKAYYNWGTAVLKLGFEMTSLSVGDEVGETAGLAQLIS